MNIQELFSNLIKKRACTFFRFPRVISFALNIVLALVCISAQAASLIDPVGDFNGADVVRVDTRITENAVSITIQYADDEIGMATGVGGNFSIDADQNPTTGGTNTPGFEYCIIFNISQLAPMAELQFLSKGLKGRSVPISANNGNGTNLQFSSRSVQFTLPLSIIGNIRDFDYALFATGMFSTGDKWDRVPDYGSARASSGRVMTASLTDGPKIFAQDITAPSQHGHIPIVSHVTTRMEGDNAVWIIQTNADLPVGPLSQYDSTHFHLMLDLDRRVETGITNGEVPFLPFGPDRVAKCTLVPGGKASIRITTGIAENGERLTVGGGAGINDLNCVFDRRSAKITIPLWLIKAESTQFDWMLMTTRLNSDPELFGGSSIAFDTGKLRLPFQMPDYAIVIDDPIEDALITEGKSDDGSYTARVRQYGIPNIDFRSLHVILTQDYLMMRVTYKTPIVPKPRYFTSINTQLPDQPSRELLFSINWDHEFGGQVVMWDLSSNEQDITQSIRLNPCLVTRGREAFLLIPKTVFGHTEPKRMGLFLTSHEMGFQKPSAKKTIKAQGIMVKAPTRQNRGTIDRLPDKGEVRLTAD